jgi:hypothetical protein
MPPLHPLVQLARDASPEARAALAAETADLFLNHSGDSDSREHILYGDVLARLYQYARQDVRARLAAALAMSEWAPRELVREIARDRIEVAQPVIVFCPVLDEAGLIDVVRTCGIEHSVCVASRDNIGEAVTDALIAKDDAQVVAALAENATARISESGYARALDIVEEETALVDLLASRPGLPASLVATAYAKAGQQARETIARRLPPDLSARLTRLVQIVCVSATEGEVGARLPDHLADGMQQRIAGPETETVILPGLPGAGRKTGRGKASVGGLMGALLRRDRNGFLRGLADLLGVEGRDLNRMLSLGGTEALCTALRAAGFEMASVRPVHDLIGRGGQGDAVWNREDERCVALEWMRNSPETARQSLRATLRLAA